MGETRQMPGHSAVGEITYNSDGLVAAIAQDAASGEVLMLAWMNADTLAETLSSGRMVYWSRSRQERWAKGDTSGDIQRVVSAAYDCDADALLFKVEQIGKGACHTGQRSCFHNPLELSADSGH
jgi:phosphoribosyl-AMP cyclohydrolase